MGHDVVGDELGNVEGATLPGDAAAACRKGAGALSLHPAREKVYGVREPIIVYQMGKVGSSSMYWSLDALRLNVPVYHLHFLNDADTVADGRNRICGCMTAN